MNSCYSEKELNGTWLGQYTNDSVFKGKLTAPQIITFHNRKYTSEDIYGNISNGTFEFSFKKIIFDNDEENFGLINKITLDSLILKVKNQNEKYIIYKKIPDSLKFDSTNKIIFKNKKFALKFKGKIDTINFVNDSILTRTYSNSRAYWKRININGFDILLIDGFNEPPLIIKERDNEKIKIFPFYNKSTFIELIEIK